MTPATTGSGSISTADELRELSTAYAAAADGRDGDRFCGLFVEEGELVVPNYPDDLSPTIIRSGHRDLRQVPDRLRRYDRTFHVVSNHQYSVDGDGASGQISCIAHHIAPAGDGSAGGQQTATDVVWYIRYLDDYRRTAEGWRFTRRELHLQWVELRPVAMLGPAWPPPGP